jgi:hypothetical protein
LAYLAPSVRPLVRDPIKLAESADDRGIEEQIERFGGQLATTRLGPGRLAHSRAALSAATTSSTEPVVE